MPCSESNKTAERRLIFFLDPVGDIARDIIGSQPCRAKRNLPYKTYKTYKIREKSCFLTVVDKPGKQRPLIAGFGLPDYRQFGFDRIVQTFPEFPVRTDDSEIFSGGTFRMLRAAEFPENLFRLLPAFADHLIAKSIRHTAIRQGTDLRFQFFPFGAG